MKGSDRIVQSSWRDMYFVTLDNLGSHEMSLNDTQITFSITTPQFSSTTLHHGLSPKSSYLAPFACSCSGRYLAQSGSLVHILPLPRTLQDPPDLGAIVSLLASPRVDDDQVVKARQGQHTTYTSLCTHPRRMLEKAKQMSN